MADLLAALLECLANGVETFWPGDHTATKAVLMLVMLIAMITVVTVSCLGHGQAAA